MVTFDRSRNNSISGAFWLSSTGGLADKVRLIVWCKVCEHQAEPAVADQVASYGGYTAVIDWARRLRCTACDWRQVDFVVSGATR